MATVFEYPPMFVTYNFPEEEIEFVRILVQGLSDLDRYQADFESALVLFQNAERIATSNPEHARIIIKWASVAARDGGMTVYHFGKAIEGIRGSFGKMPKVRGTVDHKQLKAAFQSFKKRFPLYENMRHAIAHSAELMHENKKHKADGSFDNGFIHIGDAKDTLIVGIFGDKYTTTFEGEIISYEINSDSLKALQDAKKSCWNAFANSQYFR